MDRSWTGSVLHINALIMIESIMQNFNSSRNGLLYIESSSSTSSDEEEKMLLEPEKSKKIENYVQCVVRNYSNMDFQAHFRLKRTSVKILMQELASSWESKRRPRVDIETALLLSLWTISNQESFRGIGDRFGLDRGTTRRIFRDMCYILYTKRRNYIKWPEANEMAVKALEFNNLRRNGFPDVVGCIDGSHIAIPGRKNDNSFYNRKGFHSIVLQGVCDANLKFIDVYVGWPGSVHDARVWKSSTLFDILKNNQVYDKKYHLLGDSAYPLEWFLMKPYTDNGHLNSKQRLFNTTLSRTRVAIEQAFGKLKNTFRRLKYLYCLNLRHAKHVIITACILHNIIITYSESDKNVEFELERYCNDSMDNSISHDENTQEGISKREEIAELIYRNSISSQAT